jgi:mono/diheme cytochrome c family protein
MKFEVRSPKFERRPSTGSERRSTSSARRERRRTSKFETRNTTSRYAHALAFASAAIFVASLGVALAQGDRSDGWQIPAGAAGEQSPIPPTPDVLAKGQSIFKSKCQRCHGATGVGNGPDADPDHSPGDLTDSRRASRNPDGVMFYKVWNGRTKPKMPAFKTDIPRSDAWAVVLYAKTLRR